MKLEIISPTSLKKFEIDWLEVETLRGDLVIQSGHKHSYIVIKPNSEIQLRLKEGAVEKIKINNAFLEVDRHKALLILDKE